MASYRRYKESLQEQQAQENPVRYEAETRRVEQRSLPARRHVQEEISEDELSNDEDKKYQKYSPDDRKASYDRMEEGYKGVMNTYAKQQANLSNLPGWKKLKTKGSKPPPDLYVTHVNQTKDMFRADGMEAQSSESQTSVDWLKSHSIEYLKLTMKHLVDRGKIKRPQTEKDTGKMRQKIEFDALDVNEFEYKLNVAIEEYTRRIKWLLTGSKRMYGLVNSPSVGILIDTSEANCNFGRIAPFMDSLTHLLDEQMTSKKSIYMASFGNDVWPLWPTVMDINCRTLDRHIEEAKEWVANLKPRGGCNLLNGLRHMFKLKELTSVLVILGSVPDQNADVLCDYIDQLTVGEGITIDTVAYDCTNHHTNVTLRNLAEQSGGRYHCYSSAVEEQIYSGSDVSVLLKEIETAQNVINKIKEMREGLLGTALVSIQNEISSEVSRLPPARMLPRPPGHELPLQIDRASFQPSSSSDWLKEHGLKARSLDLYQVLAPNAYSYREEYVPVLGKTVQSQVNERAMAQFKWHDGSMKNIHVDMTQLFEYQKQLGAAVKLYEKRIDWLSSASRKIFGSTVEKNVLIMIDISGTNANYLVHIQHSLRLLLEQQLANKDYFNIIAFGGEVTSWKKTLVKCSPEHLQQAWAWVLQQHCYGSRNFMGALRQAVENEEERQHNVEVEGIYLFTSGIPDQTQDICMTYVEEACAGRNLQLHVVLFNVDDYDAQGAIPSRYANITKTAESLRALAHSSGGRFHWFRETGIIESDDISLVALEIEKSLNFSKKAALLIESVKKKYGLDYTYEGDFELEASRERGLPSSNVMKALPMPRHTALSQARVASVYTLQPVRHHHSQFGSALMTGESDASASRPVTRITTKLCMQPSASAVSPEQHSNTLPPPDIQTTLGAEIGDDTQSVSKPSGWRPSSAKLTREEGKPRSGSAKDPMQRVKGKKTQKAFFYTDSGNKRAGDYVGTVYEKYANTKSVRKGVKLTNLPAKEDQLASKEWLRMYSLSKLKLDLTKMVSGPDCKHVSKTVKSLGKQAEAKYCNVFPTINIGGTLKHLQLLPHELQQYEESVEQVLRRYVKRLQWLLSGSRRVFGTVVEKNVTILVDTSGSMDFSIEELKKDLASLIWDQIHRNCNKFNLIRFSRTCERWKPQMQKPSEENCHDAVKWVSTFMANGNTCTLEALEMAFENPDLEAVYLLTDGKPDTSTSLVLREVASMNSERNVKINTISFNCDDMTANNFLKMLAAETSGRYHRCHGNFDADQFSHKLLTQGFDSPDHPKLPEFDGDDLHRLGREITQARRFLHQSRSYRSMYEGLKTPKDTPHDCLTVGPGAQPTRPPISSRPKSAVR